MKEEIREIKAENQEMKEEIQEVKAEMKTKIEQLIQRLDDL